MKPTITFLLLAATMQAASIGACAGSASVASFQIFAEPPGGGSHVALRSLNELKPDTRLVYKPGSAEQSKKAEVGLVLVTESGLTLLEPRRANQPASWTVTNRTRVVGLVYGPQGLDQKKVGKLVRKDSELIEQLAQFAEKTTQTEAAIEALLSPDPGENLDAVLRGVSGLTPGAKLQKQANANDQTLALMRALTPALSTYDPLAPDPKRVQQSMSAAASVAGMFFGSGAGLATGGAAVLVNLRTMMFPNTEFRSSFAQPASGDAMTLCAKRENQKERTRMAYLWAVRLPDAAAPSVKLKGETHIPAGMKSAIQIESSDIARLQRVQQWMLGDKPVAARVLAEASALEIDATKCARGDYPLTGQWDWSKIDTGAVVHVHTLPDLKIAKLKPASQDRLETASGTVPVDLVGADFEFVEKLSFRGVNDRSGKITDLYFKLPGGKRGGTQQELQTEIETKALAPGEYAMLLTQSGGKSQEVPFRVLPAQPKLSNLPLRVNESEKPQTIVLEGSGLERIQKIECPQATIALDGKTATVTVKPGVKRGARLDLLVNVEGVSEPLKLAGALEVVGRRPLMSSVKTSLPPNSGVAVRDGELPAGTMASLSIELSEPVSQPSVILRCRGSADQKQEARPVGDRSLFLSFDPAKIGRPGCEIEALVQGKTEGRSKAKSLGRVIRLPNIESFQLTGESAGDGMYAGALTGTDLEMIEKTGWDEKQGVPVAGLPVVSGQKQTLKIAVPWPSPAPHAPIYVWLRGETEGRATQARY